MTKTKTDPDVIARAVDDEPMQLREWGSNRVYPLPPRDRGPAAIGSAPTCWLHLQDGEQFISRRHADLCFSGKSWSIVDAGSKNGLWVDGKRADSAVLASDLEIGIGRLRLVVESPRTVRRRALLARLIGFAPERQAAVDRGLRLLREFAMGRMPLWLTGVDDLPDIGHQLHRETIGEAYPFVVRCLEASDATLSEGARAARGGTLCTWTRRTSADPGLVRSLVSDGHPPTRVIVCSAVAGAVASIDIPPLASRLHEIERVVDEYAISAIVKLGARPSSFTTTDRDWLVRHPPATLADLQTSTLRLIAIRDLGGVTHAAVRLGVTHSALSRWLRRRFVPNASTRRRPAP